MAESKNYATIKPIGQFDKNSCWAASLSWWLKAIEHSNALTQSQLISRFDYLTNSDGGISIFALKSKIYPSFGMKTVDVSIEKLAGLEVNKPLIIIYNYPEVGGTHMNVIFARTIDSSRGIQVGFTVMEPFYPLGGKDGQRTGLFITRPVSHFTTSSILIAESN
ncbi:MAG TPA: hypothetical protein PKY82_11310 [Pyrinomonadaceae bacterium]|nr:hypothetical protein [Pyrinomonadaceae bacterium]